jgi:hypothetical protein
LAELAEQGGFSRTGFALNHEDVWFAIASGEGGHLIEQRLPTAHDIPLCAIFDEGFHRFTFLVKLIRRYHSTAVETFGQLRIVLNVLQQP